MTAWASEHEAAQFTADTVNDIVAEQGSASLVAGLINLCGELLMMREEDTSADVNTTLQLIAARLDP